MPAAEIHLEAIQSMLAAGHRSLRLERHTLFLWGGVGGLLCVATDQFINSNKFPDLHQHALALLIWLSGWLGGTAWLDHRLTRRVRREREETLPFAQAQLTRAWWMLMTMGVLGSCAMFFYGGGVMVYALWTVLLGLGIYLFGLFSRPLTEWVGLATILLGATGLAAGLPLQTTRWVAAACFAIGMPLVGWMADREIGTRLPARLLALSAWILIVITPPLWFARLPVANAVPSANDQVLSLPAGTVVPLKLDLESSLIHLAPDASLPIVLNQPLEVVMQDGMPDGRYRFDGDEWATVKEGLLSVRVDRLTAKLEGGKPVIRAHAIFLNKETRR
jgi:hypothetical protein